MGVWFCVLGLVLFRFRCSFAYCAVVFSLSLYLFRRSFLYPILEKHCARMSNVKCRTRSTATSATSISNSVYLSNDFLWPIHFGQCFCLSLFQLHKCVERWVFLFLHFPLQLNVVINFSFFSSRHSRLLCVFFFLFTVIAYIVSNDQIWPNRNSVSFFLSFFCYVFVGLYLEIRSSFEVKTTFNFSLSIK